MQFIDLFLHTEKHLGDFLQAYGIWIYALLFMIIFMETGLVVTPFLPGDSLLFAVGALSANTTGMNIWILTGLLIAAAIIGNMVNYSIGRWVGPKVFHGGNRWLKQEHLIRAHAFYEKYGGKAIVLTRFAPIIRTFVPFVAGIATMDYRKFLFFNIVGGVAWVALFLLGGFYLGNLPGVKKHFEIVILLIIGVSLLPIAYEVVRGFLARKNKAL
ncbi:MAG: VTT domain-containing protein [Chthoniobacterales bacterium]